MSRNGVYARLSVASPVNRRDIGTSIRGGGSDAMVAPLEGRPGHVTVWQHDQSWGSRISIETKNIMYMEIRHNSCSSSMSATMADTVLLRQFNSFSISNELRRPNPSRTSLIGFDLRTNAPSAKNNIVGTDVILYS